MLWFQAPPVYNEDMIAIRAHFDGSVIVPDEPVPAAPQEAVVVLVDGAVSPGTEALERRTREYYQSQSTADSDEGWGKDLAADTHKAWTESDAVSDADA